MGQVRFHFCGVVAQFDADGPHGACQPNSAPAVIKCRNRQQIKSPNSDPVPDSEQSDSLRRFRVTSAHETVWRTNEETAWRSCVRDLQVLLAAAMRLPLVVPGESRCEPNPNAGKRQVKGRES
jgi:hypothetical protein